MLYEDGYSIKGVQRLMREGALRTRGKPARDILAAPAAPQVNLKVPAVLDSGRRRALKAVIAELSDMRRRLNNFLG
jgi:hypothetical protein